MQPAPEQSAQAPVCRRPSSAERWLAWLFAALLLGAHLDWWREQSATLHFGWIPEELLYRLFWLAAAWMYLLFFCARIWVEGGDE